MFERIVCLERYILVEDIVLTERPSRQSVGLSVQLNDIGFFDGKLFRLSNRSTKEKHWTDRKWGGM